MGSAWHMGQVAGLSLTTLAGCVAARRCCTAAAARQVATCSSSAATAQQPRSNNPDDPERVQRRAVDGPAGTESLPGTTSPGASKNFIVRKDGVVIPMPDQEEINARRANKRALRAVREEEKRLARNQRRSNRGRENRKNNKAHARAAREVQLAAMSDEERVGFEQVWSWV
eukprot:SAG31_NODE_4572_length_3127_cov_1.044914_2_plen_171_part_00